MNPYNLLWELQQKRKTQRKTPTKKKKPDKNKQTKTQHPFFIRPIRPSIQNKKRWFVFVFFESICENSGSTKESRSSRNNRRGFILVGYYTCLCWFYKIKGLSVIDYYWANYYWASYYWANYYWASSSLRKISWTTSRVLMRINLIWG